MFLLHVTCVHNFIACLMQEFSDLWLKLLSLTSLDTGIEVFVEAM